MKFGATFLALMIFISAATYARADDAPVTLFPQGTITAQTYITGAAGVDAHTTMATDVMGLSYYVIDNLSLGAEVSGYRVWQPHGDAYAYSAAGILRHHLFNFDRTSIFADVSFGPIEATKCIPDTGTYFNFITRAGIGAAYQLNDHLFLIGGARYFHVSNARLEGGARNPSINGIEGVVGVMWKM